MDTFTTEVELGELLLEEIRNLPDRKGPTFPVVANLSPGDFTSDKCTTTRFSDDSIDPNLLSLSNGCTMDPGTTDAAEVAQETTSKQRTPRHSAITRETRPKHQYTTRMTRSTVQNSLRKEFTRSDRSDASGQDGKRSTRSGHTRRSESISSTFSEISSIQPPDWKQKICLTRGKVSKSRAKRQTQKKPEIDSSDLDSDGMADPFSPQPSVRWKDGVMEGYDDHDSQWKKARYHHECREELIRIDARQPGAPIWTPDMGTNYTSFSTLTQGWTNDPTSVVDFKGRQVFSMEQRPLEMRRIPEYRSLMHDGFLLLDTKDKPVRDIPGLPLTLSTRAPGWFLAGLRRCLNLRICDIEARRPTTRETLTGTKNAQGPTAITNSISLWLKGNGIKTWGARPKHQGTEPSLTAKHILQRPVAIRTKSLAPARPNRRSNQLNRDLSDYDPYPSPRIDTRQARAGTYPSSDEYPPPSSWDIRISTELEEHTDTDHLPASPSYSSPFGLQNAPANIDHRFGSVHQEDSGQSQEMQWDHTGKPILWSGLEVRPTAGFFSWVPDFPSGYGNQSNNLGYPSTFPQSLHAIQPDTVHSSNIVPESPMHHVETPYYIAQKQQNHSSTNTDSFFHQPTTGINPQDSLFPTGDFLTTQPQNATEIAFVETALEYTRAEYRYLMSAEPPKSSPLLSYAEQYRDMQTYLEQTWPFPNSPPPKLRAIGPACGNSD